MHLDDLNPAQRTAASAPDGAHLVIAGAGTGKTKTLVHRVAHLIERGVAPAEIVLLTFTRRAAREMTDRVARIVGPRAHGVRGGTFHAFAVRALRQHAETLGYSRQFTVLDRADAESLVGLVRTELKLGGSDRSFPKSRTCLNLISRSINTSRPLVDLVDEMYPQYNGVVADLERLAVRFAERKREADVMDFDDLLVNLAALLKDHDAARRRLSGGARHVLVDEYQDVNKLQALIAALLASVHGNLMVVGDEAQSIYAFRGADVTNILTFPELFPGCPVTKLEMNYRSTQPVLDVANAVLETAREGYGKHLVSPHPHGVPPVLVDVLDDHEQADAVCRQILALREEGFDLTHQAVLARSGHHTNLLEVRLAEAGVPYKKYGGLRFTEASHVKDVFALLRLVANPRDALAWYRVLQWFDGLGAKTAQKVASGVAAQDPPRLLPATYKGRRYHPSLVSLAEALGEASVHRDEDVDACVDVLLTYYRERLPDLYEDHRRRERDLETLALLAERFPTLDALLEDVTLDPVESAEHDGADAEDDVLTLSTIHSAKGLEWEAVHVLSLADGAFPSSYSLDDPDALEEERRLFYVAVTRAMRRLYLWRPRMVRGGWGPRTMGEGCTLIDELPDVDDLLEITSARDERADAAWLVPETEDELARVKRMLAKLTGGD